MTRLELALLQVQASTLEVQALSMQERGLPNRRALRAAVRRLTEGLGRLRDSAGFTPPPPPVGPLQQLPRPRRDPGLMLQEQQGSKALLIEVIRRAAADWVLYRTSARLMQKQLAEDAYIWLFSEIPGHRYWHERKRAQKEVTSFLAICDALGFEPESIRAHVRKLTLQQIMCMGRPAEYRRRPSQQPPELVALPRPEQIRG